MTESGLHCKQIQNIRNLRPLRKYFGGICRDLNTRILGQMLSFSNIGRKACKYVLFSARLCSVVFYDIRIRLEQNYPVYFELKM